MCELCGPRVSRRSALALAGGVVAATIVGGERSVPVVASYAPAPLEIEPRSVWAGDSRPALGPLDAEDVRFLLVHHAASATGAEPIGVMRSVYDFHTGPERGWPDVAYNFFIDQNGVVYEARTGSLDEAVTASATGGSQGFAQLVCLLGDFTDELPTDAALDALVRTLVWLADRFEIDTALDATATFVSRGSNLWPEGETVVADTISGHREMSRTACPGDTFFPHLKRDVRSAVQALRAATPPASDPPSTAVPVPPATRPTVPPSTTTTTSTTPSVPPTSASDSEPQDTSRTSAPTAAVPGDADSSDADASTTRRSSINVPLAVAGATSLALGGVALVRGVRGHPEQAADEALDPDAEGPADA